jgi:cysteinyl-tRNA synthetase
MGGKDLAFPHHANEEMLFQLKHNCSVTKFWGHIGLVNLNGRKMSKSLGNEIFCHLENEKKSIWKIRLLFPAYHHSVNAHISEDWLKGLSKFISKKIDIEEMQKYLANPRLSKSAFVLIRNNLSLASLFSDNSVSHLEKLALMLELKILETSRNWSSFHKIIRLLHIRKWLISRGLYHLSDEIRLMFPQLFGWYIEDREGSQRLFWKLR